MLYIELLKEELRKDKTSPTGDVRAIVSSGNCAVFDEKEFDELINRTKQKLRCLISLRKNAESHMGLIDEGYLRTFGVPFKVKKLVKKKA